MTGFVAVVVNNLEVKASARLWKRMPQPASRKAAVESDCGFAWRTTGSLAAAHAGLTDVSVDVRGQGNWGLLTKHYPQVGLQGFAATTRTGIGM